MSRLLPRLTLLSQGSKTLKEGEMKLLFPFQRLGGGGGWGGLKYTFRSILLLEAPLTKETWKGGEELGSSP